MVYQLTAAHFSVSPREYARIRGGVDHPVDRWNYFQIAAPSNIAMKSVNAQRLERATIPFATRADEIINPVELETWRRFAESSRSRTSDKATNTGEKDFHRRLACRSAGVAPCDKVQQREKKMLSIFMQSRDRAGLGRRVVAIPCQE
jgi:hypothetical protein